MYRLVWLMLALSGLDANAKPLLDKVADALGGEGLTSLSYEGHGSYYSLGQSVDPDGPWPELPMSEYTRWLDYEAGSSYEDMLRPGHIRPREIRGLGGDRAWVQFGPTPPRPASADDQRLQMLLTPHGWLEAAREAELSVEKTEADGERVTILQFAAGRHPVRVTINRDRLPVRIETWLAHSLFGDMHVDTRYSDYRDWNGLRFPARIVQYQAGYPVLDLTVTGVTAGASMDLRLPDGLPPAGPAPVKPEPLADGVWLMGGGSHNSVAIEFDDFVTVVEAPLDEARSLAVIDAVKGLVPDKPIRYLVSTHHHQDHAGGIRAYVAEGAAVVAHESTRSFFNPLLTARHSIEPDRLTQDPRPAIYRLVTEQPVVIEDGSRRLEVHHVRDDPHASSMTFAWLPEEGLLIEGDVYNPFPGAPSAGIPEVLDNFYANVQRLGLDVKQVAPVHGVVTSGEDLAAAVSALP